MYMYMYMYMYIIYYGTNRNPIYMYIVHLVYSCTKLRVYLSSFEGVKAVM